MGAVESRKRRIKDVKLEMWYLMIPLHPMVQNLSHQTLGWLLCMTNIGVILKRVKVTVFEGTGFSPSM